MKESKIEQSYEVTYVNRSMGSSKRKDIVKAKSQDEAKDIIGRENIVFISITQIKE